MNDPRCPACRSELSLAHALRMPNPWRYECPECAASIEAGPSHKVLMVVGPMLTGSAVLAALSLHQAEVLNAPASFTFMLACTLSVLAGHVWAWQRTTFTRKPRS